MKLSKNNQLVYDALQAAGRSMGAYEVIDAVRPAGITAPPTVYRALSKLIELGIVHRIESTNAFVVCNGKHEGDDAIMLMICSKCARTDEFARSSIDDMISTEAEQRAFKVSGTVLEVRGVCHQCDGEGVS